MRKPNSDLTLHGIDPLDVRRVIFFHVRKVFTYECRRIKMQIVHVVLFAVYRLFKSHFIQDRI